MHRRDAIIGAIGAVLVLASAVGVGVAGSALSTFEVRYPVAPVTVAEGSETRENVAGATIVVPLEVPRNATMLFANVSVDAVGAPQATARATLTAPDGTIHEAEAEPSGTAAAPRLVASFAIRGKEPPPPERQEARQFVVVWLGDPLEAWTLEVAFSTGTPLPTPRATVSWEADALAWQGEVHRVVPAAR